METILECFDVIVTGNKDPSRQAARKVRKLVYGSEGGQYESIRSIIENAPRMYEKITEDWRQENFVVAVSVLYFLHDREKEPDFLFFWLFKLLQHDRGNIRQAAVRMIQHEIGSLTYHIRFPNRKSGLHDVLPEDADDILFGLYSSLKGLLRVHWEPGYGRYKYVSSLPSGVYKSAQLILSRMYEDCGEEYIAKLR